jgi:hypothetical protein
VSGTVAGAVCALGNVCVGQSVANTVKRVVIIIAGSIVFNKPLTQNGNQPPAQAMLSEAGRTQRCLAGVLTGGWREREGCARAGSLKPGRCGGCAVLVSARAMVDLRGKWAPSRVLGAVSLGQRVAGKELSFSLFLSLSLSLTLSLSLSHTHTHIRKSLMRARA